MNIGTFFTAILIKPFATVLVAIYHVLFLVHVPFALGFSIILLTVLIRVILHPFTSSQLNAQKKMQSLSPHLAKLKQQHKGDSKRIQAETMKLYKEHGINPAAGCLPLLIQLPILIGLYQVLQRVVALNGKTFIESVKALVYFPNALVPTKPWDTTFFGLSLGQSPGVVFKAGGFLILLIPLFTVVLQLLQAKMMMPKAVKEYPSDSPKEKKEKEKSEDAMAAVQSQMTYLMPLMIGVFSFQFPLGISLYWNTLNIFGIIQQYRISGLGGLEDWVGKIKKK